MTKLLSASFRRLMKAKIFWLGIAFTAVFSLFLCYANYLPTKGADQLSIDEVFFTFYSCLCLVCATVITLFIGTEYSDGTVRNKLVIGHRRISIYFSNLIVCIAASVVIIAVHSILTLSVGHFIFDEMQIEMKDFIYAVFCILLIAAVYSAMCVMISMNCHNKAVSAVAAILLMLALSYLASMVSNQLLEQPMTYSSIVMTEDTIQYGDLVENPAYVDGVTRKVLEFIYNLLPTGQIQQIYNCDFENSSSWPIVSLGLFALLSSVGAAIFKRKDLK